jgi:hypothetical protein
MTYIIKIQEKSTKAKGIINLLKALKEDCDFIEIREDISAKTDLNVDKELILRYKSFLEDNKGKDWEKLKLELT